MEHPFDERDRFDRETCGPRKGDRRTAQRGLPAHRGLKPTRRPRVLQLADSGRGPRA